MEHSYEDVLIVTGFDIQGLYFFLVDKKYFLIELIGVILLWYGDNCNCPIRPSCPQQMSHLRRGHPHISPLATSISGITVSIDGSIYAGIKMEEIQTCQMEIWLFNWTIHF